MDILQVDILSALKEGSTAEIAQKMQNPFKVVRELLERDGIGVVDVANIDVLRAGNSIWTQTSGQSFHVKKLERLVFVE